MQLKSLLIKVSGCMIPQDTVWQFQLDLNFSNSAVTIRSILMLLCSQCVLNYILQGSLNGLIRYVVEKKFNMSLNCRVKT